MIAHLYPREMNIYGDMGNVIVLQKRLEWRGFEAEVKAVEVGEQFDFGQVDLVFGGGGQDSGQVLICEDLLKRGEELRQAVSEGMPMLVICGTYQLFGRGFTTLDGQELPGINVFSASTAGSQTRMIGNVVVDSQFGQLVGFENHSGQTALEPGQKPLGVVRKGYGNDANSGHEGAISLNAIGTYMHGPLLPKNPLLADHLLQIALQRKNDARELVELDNSHESLAAKVAARRPQ